MRVLNLVALLLLPVAARAIGQSGSLNGAAGNVSGTMTAGFFKGDGSELTNVTASSYAAHVNASLTGDGTPSHPFGVASSTE